MLLLRIVLISLFVFMCAVPLYDRKQCKISSFVIHCENVTLSRPFAIEEAGNAQTLKIHSCDIQNNSIDGKDFHLFSSLNTLIIKNSSLVSLERSSFSELSKLVIVSIQDTEWEVFHPGQFKNNTQLHKLLLSRNKITSIPQDAFPSDLEELDLSHNRIANISPSTFDGLHSLLLLKLRGNQLTGIGSENTFPSSLKFLLLDSNNISKIEPGVFSNCADLEELILSFNQIRSLPEGIFRGLHNLTVLRLDNNIISQLAFELFDFPSSLKFLHLDSNYISEIEPGVFSNCADLEELILSFNQIRSLPEGIFHGLHNLTVLRLDNNIISQLALELFSTLDSLRFLFLQTNKIEHIQLHTLKIKSISQLHIDSYLLEGKHFPKLENIFYLYIKIREYQDIVLSFKNECAGNKCNDVLRNSINPNEILRCPDDESCFLKIPNVFNDKNQNNLKYDSKNKLCKEQSSEINYYIICFTIVCADFIKFLLYKVYVRLRKCHKPFSPLRNVSRPHERNCSENEDAVSENLQLIPNVDGRPENLALGQNEHAVSMCQFRNSSPKLPDSVSRSDEEGNREASLWHNLSTSTENTERGQSNQSSVFSIPPPVMADNLLTRSASNALSANSSVLPRVLRPPTVINACKSQEDTQKMQAKIKNKLIKINNNKETTKERNAQPLCPIVATALQNDHSQETGHIQLRKLARSTSYLPDHNLNPSSLPRPTSAPQLLNQSTRLQHRSTFTSGGRPQFGTEAAPLTAYTRQEEQNAGETEPKAWPKKSDDDASVGTAENSGSASTESI